MAALGAAGSSAPMGHSLGADLILDHAAALPEGPRALVLIDGTAPTPRPLLTEDELTVIHEGFSSEEALHAHDRRPGHRDGSCCRPMTSSACCAKSRPMDGSRPRGSTRSTAGWSLPRQLPENSE